MADEAGSEEINMFEQLHLESIKIPMHMVEVKKQDGTVEVVLPPWITGQAARDVAHSIANFARPPFPEKMYTPSKMDKVKLMWPLKNDGAMSSGAMAFRKDGWSLEEMKGGRASIKKMGYSVTVNIIE